MGRLIEVPAIRFMPHEVVGQGQSQGVTGIKLAEAKAGSRPLTQQTQTSSGQAHLARVPEAE